MEDIVNEKTQKKAERVIIFIDGSNFYHSVNETFNVHDNQIDFRKLIEELNAGRFLIAVYYYNASLDIKYNKDVYWKQQKFFADLKKIPGFNVVLAYMRKIASPSGRIEYSVKGDDIHLGIDMVSLAYEDQYDTAILVSGDGDFEPAIKRAQRLGKKVENAYFSVSRSSLLKQVCNQSILLDDIIEKCLKENK